MESPIVTLTVDSRYGCFYAPALRYKLYPSLSTHTVHHTEDDQQQLHDPPSPTTMTREEVTAESQATTRTAKSLTTSPNLESAEDTLEDVRDTIQWIK